MIQKVIDLERNFANLSDQLKQIKADFQLLGTQMSHQEATIASQTNEIKRSKTDLEDNAIAFKRKKLQLNE